MLDRSSPARGALFGCLLTVALWGCLLVLGTAVFWVALLGWWG